MQKKLLVIGYVWPEPDTTAAGCRMQQLLETFVTFGYEITFASTATKTKYSMDLESMGIQGVPVRLNHSSFDEFVKGLAPDVVLFDRFMVEEQFGWRVAEFAPNAVRILNTEDLHALRKAREEAHKKGRSFNLAQWKNHPTTLREVASIYRCDLSLMISTYEMKILSEQLGIPDGLLLHVPFMADAPSDTTKKDYVPFEARKGFVSIGNGKHAPNVDAVKMVKEEVWPSIRKRLPDAEIRIYGAYLPQQINKMHSPKTGFYVEGWAENAHAVLEKARVLLASLRFGAGIKGKLFDAMQTGTPSITTTIGAEGMLTELPWSGAIADDWDDFARTAVEIHQEEKAWQAAQQNGDQILRSFYNKETVRSRFKERLQQISKNLESHRSQNFIGKLLQHQTMAGTKYMSKWIEEKNKAL